MDSEREPGSLLDVPGAFEVIAARRFFAALAARDAALLIELLDEAPTFRNIDGPVPVVGRGELARALADRGEGVRHHVAEVAGSPGEARVRFILVVEGVPGGIVLEALLTFFERRLRDIVVTTPDDRR